MSNLVLWVSVSRVLRLLDGWLLVDVVWVGRVCVLFDVCCWLFWFGKL